VIIGAGVHRNDAVRGVAATNGDQQGKETTASKRDLLLAVCERCAVAVGALDVVLPAVRVRSANGSQQLSKHQLKKTKEQDNEKHAIGNCAHEWLCVDELESEAPAVPPPRPLCRPNSNGALSSTTMDEQRTDHEVLRHAAAAQGGAAAHPAGASAAASATVPNKQANNKQTNKTNNGKKENQKRWSQRCQSTRSANQNHFAMRCTSSACAVKAPRYGQTASMPHLSLFANVKPDVAVPGALVPAAPRDNESGNHKQLPATRTANHQERTWHRIQHSPAVGGARAARADAGSASRAARQDQYATQQRKENKGSDRDAALTQ
jgi:hypothetical protein